MSTRQKILLILFRISIPLILLFILFIWPISTLFVRGKIVGALSNTHWINSTQEVFFRDFRKGGMQEGLSSISLNGENKRFYCDDIRYICFSPEGDRLATITYSNAKRGGDIAILDLKMNKSEIVENNRHCSNPVWTPDGGKIVYISEQDRGLVVYNILSKEKRIIKMTANYPTNNRFVISHTGDQIIYQDYISGPSEYLEGIFQYDILSGEVKNLSGLKKDMPKIFDFIKPDDVYWGNGGGGLNIGSSLPVSSSSGKGFLGWKEGSLYLNTNGKEEILVQYKGPRDSKFNRGVEGYIWSPDEKFVLFELYDSIYAVDITTKKTGILCKKCSKPMLYYPIYKPFNETNRLKKVILLLKNKFA